MNAGKTQGYVLTFMVDACGISLVRISRSMKYFSLSCCVRHYTEHTDSPMVPTTVGRRQLGGLTCGL
jgi:hypothetical protein